MIEAFLHPFPHHGRTPRRYHTDAIAHSTPSASPASGTGLLWGLRRSLDPSTKRGPANHFRAMLTLAFTGPRRFAEEDSDDDGFKDEHPQSQQGKNHDTG